jgi:hypothetical protein
MKQATHLQGGTEYWKCMERGGTDITSCKYINLCENCIRRQHKLLNSSCFMLFYLQYFTKYNYLEKNSHVLGLECKMTFV